jgi:hypothetical protein
VVSAQQLRWEWRRSSDGEGALPADSLLLEKPQGCVARGGGGGVATA